MSHVSTTSVRRKDSTRELLAPAKKDQAAYKGRRGVHALVLNSAVLLIVYAAMALTVGGGELARLAGAGILAGFLYFQDVSLLSKHTHVPQNLSEHEESGRPRTNSWSDKTKGRPQRIPSGIS